MDNRIDYKRLSSLGNKVKAGGATKKEQDEYMSILYENGNITEKQYGDYKANRNIDDVVSAALAVGAIVLIGYLLDKIFD